MGGSARVNTDGDDMPIPGTSLRALVDRNGTFHVTGPCGAVHSMPEDEAIALWTWLGWRLSDKPKPFYRVGPSLTELLNREPPPPTLASRMASDPTQDWT